MCSFNIVTLVLQGGICHFVKWQIQHSDNKGGELWSLKLFVGSENRHMSVSLGVTLDLHSLSVVDLSAYGGETFALPDWLPFSLQDDES